MSPMVALTGSLKVTLGGHATMELFLNTLNPINNPSKLAKEQLVSKAATSILTIIVKKALLPQLTSLRRTSTQTAAPIHLHLLLQNQLLLAVVLVPRAAQATCVLTLTLLNQANAAVARVGVTLIIAHPMLLAQIEQLLTSEI